MRASGRKFRAAIARFRYGSKLRIGLAPKISRGVQFKIRGKGYVTIGDRVLLEFGCIIDPHGGSIEMGDDCSVNQYSILYGNGGLKIGNGVRIAAHSVIVAANHGTRLGAGPIHKQPLSREGIDIGDDVWIGANCTILDGVSIADGCVIAAGAVVSRSTKPNGIYGGIPARRLRDR